MTNTLALKLSQKQSDRILCFCYKVYSINDIPSLFRTACAMLGKDGEEKIPLGVFMNGFLVPAGSERFAEELGRHGGESREQLSELLLIRRPPQPK